MNVREIVPWFTDSATYRTDPFWAFEKQLSSLFEDAFPASAPRDLRSGVGDAFADFSPKVNVTESDASFTVTLEVPGIAASDIKVQLDGRILTVSGERKVSAEADQSKGTRYQESSFGRFRRSIKLGVDVQDETVDASLKDGVLTLTLPKRAPEARGGKTISIRSE